MTAWKKTDTSVVAENRIFRLRRDRVVNPRNEKHLDAFVLECPDWVNVIALTHEEDVVLVRQFRHGVERLALEIPGGVVDPGEAPADAALRELLEETGYAPDRLESLGFVDAQPGYQDNRCHTFLALGVKRVAEPELDAGEDIEVVKVPRTALADLVRSGEISHSLVIAAFHLFALHQGG
jgi:8-oxo-dGTP pyrophosphatase MutT (NUDIX family)